MPSAVPPGSSNHRSTCSRIQAQDRPALERNTQVEEEAERQRSSRHKDNTRLLRLRYPPKHGLPITNSRQSITKLESSFSSRPPLLKGANPLPIEFALFLCRLPS